MLRSRRLDMRGVWLDSNTLELCSQAFRVGRWPIGIRHAACQIYRVPCVLVEAGRVRRTVNSNSGHVFTQQQRCGQRDN